MASVFKVFYVNRQRVRCVDFTKFPGAAAIFVRGKGERFAIQHLKTKGFWRLYDFDRLNPYLTTRSDPTTMRMPPAASWETYPEFEVALAAALLQL